MNSRDFCYWLQGIFEVAQPTVLNEEAVAKIKAHLNMVFIHEIDPSFPAEQQAALTEAHKPKKPSTTPAVYHPSGSVSVNNQPLMRC